MHLLVVLLFTAGVIFSSGCGTGAPDDSGARGTLATPSECALLDGVELPARMPSRDQFEARPAGAGGWDGDAICVGTLEGSIVDLRRIGPLVGDELDAMSEIHRDRISRGDVLDWPSISVAQVRDPTFELYLVFRANETFGVLTWRGSPPPSLDELETFIRALLDA